MPFALAATVTAFVTDLASHAQLVALAALLLVAVLHTIGRLGDRSLAVTLAAIGAFCLLSQQTTWQPVIGALAQVFANRV